MVAEKCRKRVNINFIQNEISLNSERTILVDFDFTLFAANSTEKFLENAQPAFVALPILAIIRNVVPRLRLLSPHKATRFRDYLSLTIVCLFMPWNLTSWRRQAKMLFRSYTNHALANLLRDVPPQRIFIVSFGYSILIDPLLEGSHWESCRKQYMSFPFCVGNLFQPKILMLKKVMSEQEISSSIFITRLPRRRGHGYQQ